MSQRAAMEERHVDLSIEIKVTVYSKSDHGMFENRTATLTLHEILAGTDWVPGTLDRFKTLVIEAVTRSAP